MDENQIIDTASCALGVMLDVHRKFKERHEQHAGVPSEAHLHSNVEVHQPNHSNETEARQTSALNVSINERIRKHSSPFSAGTAMVHVKQTCADSFDETDYAGTCVDNVTCNDNNARTVALEEILVSPAYPLQRQPNGASDKHLVINESTDHQRNPAIFSGPIRDAHADLWKDLVNQEINLQVWNTATAGRGAGNRNRNIQLAGRFLGGRMDSNAKLQPRAKYAAENDAQSRTSQQVVHRTYADHK